MPSSKEYQKKRRRTLFIAYGAIVIGVLGLAMPALPGFVFLLFGLSVLSLESSSAHRHLAHLRARFPKTERELEKLETWLTDTLNLSTHSHRYQKIPAGDGKKLAVLVEVSRLRPAGTAILLHRASGTKETSVQSAVAEGLREQDLNIVRFDAYHGLGESKGEFALFTASEYLKDLEEVIAWVKTQHWFKAPLILAGHSLGGLVAGVYAVRHPEEVHQLILVAPTVSGESYLRALEQNDPGALTAWKDRGVRTLKHPFTRVPYGLGYAYVEDIRSYDLLRDADKLTMPVSIISGTIDIVSPHEDCRSLVAALGGRASFFPLEGVPHVPRGKVALDLVKHAVTDIRLAKA